MLRQKKSLQVPFLQMHVTRNMYVYYTADKQVPSINNQILKKTPKPKPQEKSEQKKEKCECIKAWTALPFLMKSESGKNIVPLK